MNEDLLGENFDQFFLVVERVFGTIDSVARDRFLMFHRVLTEWNLRINLVSRKEVCLLDRHFLNSLAIAFFAPFRSSDRVADIGSGGGFPAIPLKIIFPHTEFVLFEATRKKAEFLKVATGLLHMDGIDIVNQNVDHINKKESFAGRFDFVTARAVAPIDRLVKMSSPFLRAGGRMIFLKGTNYQKELTSSQRQELLISDFSLADCPLLSGRQNGHLLVIRKPHGSL